MAKQQNPTENKPQSSQSQAAPEVAIQPTKPIIKKEEKKVDTAALDSATASRLMHKLEDVVSGSGIDLNKGNVTHH